MSRVRQEAKILKNYHREVRIQYSEELEELFLTGKRRYALSRIYTADKRLVKACKRRYLNDARKAKKEGDISTYRLSIHNANSPYLADDAYEWWNIKTE